MARLELSNIRKSFGRVDVLENIDLVVEDGEFCVFVGPSGCGKSTLLRIVAGLERNTTGRVVIGGTDVTAAAPADRGVAMVFQSYALYPHMDVARNIGFGLMMQGVDKATVRNKVNAAADLLQIGPLLARRPSELSGGQRQRVAIGRALVRDPKIFLFDEPLSNLDAALRVQMRIEITRLHKELGTTMIYVTHDQTEAMTMADRIVVLNGGHIEQTGDPLTLYNKPENIFVAGFMGSPKMNFIPASIGQPVDGGAVVTLATGQRLVLPTHRDTAPISEAMLGVRAENIKLVGPAGDGVKGVVQLVENLGSEALVHVDCGFRDNLVVKDAGLTRWSSGDVVGVAIDPGACHLFDGAGNVFQTS